MKPNTNGVKPNPTPVKKPTNDPLTTTEPPKWFREVNDDDVVILATVTINKEN